MEKEKGKKTGSLRNSNRRDLAKKYTSEYIKSMRKQSSFSQQEFAEVLNAAIETVRCWEQARSVPAGTALKLLEVFEYYPEILT